MPGKTLGESLQLGKLGTKVIRQRSSIYQGTDIQDVALGKLASNLVCAGGRNLVRNEANDRLEPRSWALSWGRPIYTFLSWQGTWDLVSEMCTSESSFFLSLEVVWKESKTDQETAAVIRSRNDVVLKVWTVARGKESQQAVEHLPASSAQSSLLTYTFHLSSPGSHAVSECTMLLCFSLPLQVSCYWFLVPSSQNFNLTNLCLFHKSVQASTALWSLSQFTQEELMCLPLGSPYVIYIPLLLYFYSFIWQLFISHSYVPSTVLNNGEISQSKLLN